MPGKFLPVLTNGTFLRTQKDPNAAGATEIALSSLGVTAGDYLSLQPSGSFTPGTGFPPAQSMIACFFAGNMRAPPGKHGQQDEVTTPPTYFDGLPTNIPEDFDVPFNRKIIVRAPSGATAVRFCPNDSFYGDNSSNDYGVTIARPNMPTPVPGKTQTKRSTSLSVFEEDHTALRNEIAKAISTMAFPEVAQFGSSPIDEALDSGPQWRGHYTNKQKKGVWVLENSYYRKKAAGGYRKHEGWDIFAPRGSTLIAPVYPALLWLISPISGFGRVVAMGFQHKSETYVLAYGHVESQIGANRKITGHEPVATAGCEGNSGKELCGTELNTGGYTDHVHIGLYKATTAKKGKDIDPATLFNWNIVTPN